MSANNVFLLIVQSKGISIWPLLPVVITEPPPSITKAISARLSTISPTSTIPLKTAPFVICATTFGVNPP